MSTKNICFYFQVHQPVRLRTYRFFDIGKDHYYYDDFANRQIMKKVADKCYLPMNRLLLELIQQHNGQFKVSFSITGTALDQFEAFAPEVLESFQQLAATGCVEFLAETYSHSLSSLQSKEEFMYQVHKHSERIAELFGVTPTVFRNTELIYNDRIGEMVYQMGYKGMLTEGARHVLAWKSPNFLYYHPSEPKLKLLLKNFRLSDDIAFRFSEQAWSEWPLTTEKYVDWVKALPWNEEVINLFMDYETFGEHQWESTGIFDFMRTLPERILNDTEFTFHTPGEVIQQLQPVSALHVPDTISWADEERDLTAWLGNDLQDDAFQALYSCREMVDQCDDPALLRDWAYLQTSDHFYYMCTKFFNDGDVHKYFNHYDSPYEAYINYMNVLADFKARLQTEINNQPNTLKPFLEYGTESIEARLDF